MVGNHLTRALRGYLAKVLGDFRLPAESGEHRPPRIVNGYLPPKRSGMNDDFPFVIVRPESGKIESDETNITVSIVIGCYTNETSLDGHEHCLNVASRICNALTMLPNQTLDKRFILGFPISWVIPDEQGLTYWQLDMKTQWTTKTPEIRSESEEEIYGF